MTLHLQTQPAMLSLAPRSDPQICYLLVQVQASPAAPTTLPLSCAVVADASRSMRIPIISEEQFRQLVRSDVAQEVLVDGLPVWQFNRPVPAHIARSAPSALGYIAQALLQVLGHFQPQDSLALVACAERAEVLAPATTASAANLAQLRQQINRLRDVDLGKETDLSVGLQLAIQELHRAQTPDAQHVRRLLLLTDGFTQNPGSVITLVQQAVKQGIAVSTLGWGSDFQEDLLIALADMSGGRALFLRKADDIPTAVAHELAQARAVTARAVTLSISLSAGVELRGAASINPALALLEPLTTPGQALLHLGDLGQHTPVSLLLEFQVQPTAWQTQPARLAHLLATAAAPPISASVEIGASVASVTAPPPAAVLAAAARANVLRLQQRALAAATRGNYKQAAGGLRLVAARLRELGQPGLAHIAQQEAVSLENTGKLSKLGAKELTYTTRRLPQEQP